jgi:hypothetical protein
MSTKENSRPDKVLASVMPEFADQIIIFNWESERRPSDLIGFQCAAARWRAVAVKAWIGGVGEAAAEVVRSGTLQFSRRHAVLLEQMRLFPKAAHDDRPDARRWPSHRRGV